MTAGRLKIWNDLASAWEYPPGAPSGGSSAATEQIQGNTVSTAAGAIGSLTWDTKLSGSTVVDISTPAFAAIMVDGVYSFVVNFEADEDLTVGANYRYSLLVGAAAGGNFPVPVAIDAASAPATAGQLAPGGAMTFPPVSLVVGDHIVAHVQNFDSVTRGFILGNAIVTKLG